jgi:hypothetical protein
METAMLVLAAAVVVELLGLLAIASGTGQAAGWAFLVRGLMVPEE